MFYSLEGNWSADIGDGKVYSVCLPGTLDENKIGGRDGGSRQWHPDSALGNADFKEGGAILTRFTRKYTYEGVVRLTRHVSFAVPSGKRVFLEAERARRLKLLVDGKEIPDFRTPTISTPHVFEVTEVWKGKHEITLLSDNRYQGLPRDAILASSAATDETQTNWNGILGYFRLRVEEAVFLEGVRVYPMGERLTVKVDVCADRAWSGGVALYSEALEHTAFQSVSVGKGRTEVVLEGLPITGGVPRWEEYEGHLGELTACLTEEVEAKGEAAEEVLQCGEEGYIPCHKPGHKPFHTVIGRKTVTFGIREFGADEGGRLVLNGRRIFLRGEANCAVFPETGYCPLSVGEWTDILRTYRSYGVNCVRFHSHCPPEAAFLAAVREGMLMQPELSHWNPVDAFESEESVRYYRAELEEILWMLANHPSFVMLTLGNELHASEKGHKRMRELLELARRLDAARLYADGSNVHYGAIGCDAYSDFYTSSKYRELDLRGTFADMEGYLNHSYPGAGHNYDKAMDALRETYAGPVFSFEVGQFEVLPDFGELEEFKGVTEPANLRRIKERVEESGLLPVWKRYVEAGGELAVLCYREEIEAAMRTERLSGISLLGIQDFPGQGTALVGMLNSHLRPKPYGFAQPEAFRAFFASCLPLVLLPKYTYENTEVLEADVRMANFGREHVAGELHYWLEGRDMKKQGTGDGGWTDCPAGAITEAGRLRIPLSFVKVPSRLDLTVSMGGVSNRYPVWVYPPVSPVCPDGIYETTHLDERAREALDEGRSVYLSPPSTKEALPQSIQAQFTTDFWSVATFAGQEGGMGQLIDTEHPVFSDFPTEFHTNWQWWPMAGQRAAVLPKPYRAIITEMDCVAYLRPMAQLLECRCRRGKLLFSTMGLQDLQEYPEARALLASIYRYLDSGEFAPEQEIEWEVMASLVI